MFTFNIMLSVKSLHSLYFPKHPYLTFARAKDFHTEKNAHETLSTFRTKSSSKMN